MPVARPHGTLRLMAIQMVVALCALSPSVAGAQVSCEDWNTGKFFEEARAQDITRCVAAGSDPNARSDAGYTPLHSAAANSTEPAVVARLLDAGADAEARGNTGLTPLHVVAAGSPEPAMVAILVDAGADLEARDQAGLTPLHAAAASSSVPAMIAALVDAGADLDARNDAGYSPLHAAAASSSVPAMVAALVDAGADLEARTESGLTPLLVAAAGSSSPAMVTALVSAGADLEARTESGLTPLHVAAGISETSAVVSALVNAGVEPNARDQENKTAGDYVQFNEALKGTEAYGLLEDTITVAGPDMVEGWMRLGSMIVWGAVVLGGLMVWGLFSSSLSRRVCYAGSVATYVFIAIVSFLAPDWAVALSARQPFQASLTDTMATSVEAGILATWALLGIAGLVYSFIFRGRSRRVQVVGVVALSSVVVVASHYASDWVFLFD